MNALFQLASVFYSEADTYRPTKPAIILADEPTGNLDTSTSHDVIGLLKMLSRQYQQTLIVITHDNDIAQMADRIVQIEDGKISTKGSDFHVSE